MSLTSIWRSFGYGWFCLLSMLTAGVIISMDYEIGSLKKRSNHSLSVYGRGSDFHCVDGSMATHGV